MTTVAGPVEGRAMVMHRAMGHCEAVSPACTGSPLEWHHRQSRRTGIHGPGNGLGVCRPCHRFAHANPGAAMDRGWIVPTHVPDPSTIPALVRGRWVVLTPGGTYQ